MLPEITGIELIKIIRMQYIETPIVITTNLGSGYNLDEVKSLGVADIILKSITGPKELRQILVKYS